VPMIRGKLLVIALVLGVLAGSDAAWACNCPKEQMIRKYGTLLPVPPASQPPAQPLPASGGQPNTAPRQDGQSAVQ
jgi:hypothetical protein